MATADPIQARHFRQQNLALRAATLRDAMRLWPALDVANMEETFPAWLAAQRILIRRDHRRTAALASAYLKAARFSSGVPGSPVVLMADPPPDAQVVAAMSTTARAGFFKALQAGRTVEEARQVALVRTLGATGRLALLGGRDTVRYSLAADPRGAGWQRIASGSACAFCRMLAGRGAVYSAETADFSAHDHCGCTVAAVYSAEPIAVRAYEPSDRGRWSDRATDADRDRMADALAGI